MKILLLNPSQHSAYGSTINVPVFFPIGLGYIGAVLENAGHEAYITDIDNENISYPALEAMLVHNDYGLIGITATSPTINSAFRLAKFIRSKVKSPIIFGGVHPTLFPEHPFSSPDVDFVIRGEGEETILKLVESLDGKISPGNILGLSYRDGANIRHNDPRPPIANLDKLPFPISHRLNSKRYTFTNALMKKIAPIMTSRGCPGRCTYCCTKKMFGLKLRYRSAGNVLNEIKYLRDSCGVQEIHIWDDNFISNKRFIIELRDLMRKDGMKIKISLMNGVRVDYFNEEIAGYLRDMGVYSIGFGIESGNQDVLDGIKKGIKLETSQKALRIAKNYGFETWGFFMLGLLGDDRKTIEETIRFSLKIDPDIAKFHILKPFPGTEIYEEMKARGLLLSDDYDRYSIHSAPVHKLPTLTADELIALQKKAYRAFYFRPGKILKQILNIKTMERAKSNLQAALSIFKITKR